LPRIDPSHPVHRPLLAIQLLTVRVDGRPVSTLDRDLNQRTVLVKRCTGVERETHVLEHQGIAYALRVFPMARDRAIIQGIERAEHTRRPLPYDTELTQDVLLASISVPTPFDKWIKRRARRRVVAPRTGYALTLIPVETERNPLSESGLTARHAFGFGRVVSEGMPRR